MNNLIEGAKGVSIDQQLVKMTKLWSKEIIHTIFSIKTYKGQIFLNIPNESVITNNRTSCAKYKLPFSIPYHWLLYNDVMLCLKYIE